MKDEGTVRDGGKPAKVIRICSCIAILVLQYPYDSWFEWVFATVLVLLIPFDLIDSRTLSWDNNSIELQNRFTKNKQYDWSDVSSITEDQIEYHIFTPKGTLRIRKKKASSDFIEKLSVELNKRSK